MRAPITRLSAAALAAVLLACGPPPEETLKVYLLCGQSNMEGQGYTYDESLEWLSRSHPAATTLETLLRDTSYTRSLDPERYGFAAALDARWLAPRDDVWAVHVDSATGALLPVKSTPREQRETWTPREGPLAPGFGKDEGEHSTFGPELALGHRLGDALQGPIYLFKADHAATSLQLDWRPPVAVAERGGELGAHYRNAMERFAGFLARLDADLAADGVLERYGGARGYEVAGFVWFQGYHDELIGATDDYEQNLVALVESVRADLALPELPVIVVETAGRNWYLADARRKAVRRLSQEHRGSAVYLKTRGLNEGHANGIHFELRAENHLEIGWRVAGAVLKNRYTAGESPVD